MSTHQLASSPPDDLIKRLLGVSETEVGRRRRVGSHAHEPKVQCMECGPAQQRAAPPPPSQNTPRPSRTCPSAARGMTYVKPPGVGRPTGRRTVVAALTDTRRAPTENWVRKAWD